MWRTRGHETAIELLKASLAQDRISHAYLITGPERIGKSTLAMELAMALNCSAWQGEPQGLFGGIDTAILAEPAPCYQCTACSKALAGSHPDLQVLEEWTTERGSMTDQVRSIQYGAGLLPFEGRRKVYVLMHAEDMTGAAQNTLLKTLEEPAPTVCLIVTAATPRSLLPTVVSRCQHIQLRAPSSEEITQALVDLKGLEPSEAQKLAELSSGRIGWAMAAVNDASLLELRQAAIEHLATALGGGTVERLRLAEGLAAGEPQALDDVFELWLGWLRDLLLVIEGCDERIVNRDQAEALHVAAARIESRAVQRAIRTVQITRAQVAGAINTRMALEVLMLKLPKLARPAPA